MKKVAILGFGPSSMFTIMACNDRDIAPTVIGGDIVKVPAGAFYYHWLPVEYSKLLERQLITYRYVGNAGTYSMKQWGKDSYPSSFWKYGVEYGYSPKDTFEIFQKKSAFKHISSDMLTTDDVFAYCGKYDLVVCTFPLKEMMDTAKKVYRPVVVRPSSTKDNIIIYSGKSDDKWVRWSNLFDMTYIEYCNSEDVPNTKDRVVSIIDLHPDMAVQAMFTPSNLIFSGRYAEFNRKRLAHEAYDKMTEVLDAF